MNPTPDIYDADYYLNGQATGKSLYIQYRWMPALTKPFCQRIIEHLGIEKNDTTLDFGCARGFTVRAFHELGYKCHGVDCSEWAIENCDETIRGYVYQGHAPWADFDWILAKDVLEHIPTPQLRPTVERLVSCAKKGLFAVVPLSNSPGCPYVIPEYEQDITHCQRLTLDNWVDLFRLYTHGESIIEACYRIEGIKDNWYTEGYERGNGFITVRKLQPRER